jgi:tetratricopeptide (TPR) repeat protein
MEPVIQQTAPIDRLPDPVLIRILRLNFPNGTHAEMKVCRRWRALCTSDPFWQDIAARVRDVPQQNIYDFLAANVPAWKEAAAKGVAAIEADEEAQYVHWVDVTTAAVARFESSESLERGFAAMLQLSRLGLRPLKDASQFAEKLSSAPFDDVQVWATLAGEHLNLDDADAAADCLMKADPNRVMTSHLATLVLQRGLTEKFVELAARCPTKFLARDNYLDAALAYGSPEVALQLTERWDELTSRRLEKIVEKFCQSDNRERAQELMEKHPALAEEFEVSTFLEAGLIARAEERAWEKFRTQENSLDRMTGLAHLRAYYDRIGRKDKAEEAHQAILQCLSQ